jgi:transposase
MRPHGSPEELERRRKRAIALLEEGLAPVEVAKRLGVDRRSVRRWKAAHRQGGRRALQAKPAPGRPPKLQAGDRKQLEEILLAGAKEAGYPSDLWTCRRVAEVLSDRFGVFYHPGHVARLLHALGWSPQKPQRRASERDDARVQRWVKQDWPRIKKKPGASGPTSSSSTKAAS